MKIWKSLIRILFQVGLPTVIGLVAMLLAIAWLSGFFEEKITPGRQASVARQLDRSAKVMVDQVHEVSKQYVAEAVGTLHAATRTEIAARIMAPIEQIRVKAGDTVKAGDVLVLLDRRDMDVKLSQAKAALVGAEAALTQAEKDYQRDVELFREQVIAESQFDQSTAKRKIALANLDQAKQAVAAAEVMLSYTTIAASQDGTIVDRLAEPGDIASPGVPLLVLYDRSSLRLEVPVMEDLAVKLRRGQELTVKIDAVNREVKATVDEIVPQAEAASRSFLVKMKLPRSEGLFEGMFGRLLIPAGVRTHLCLDTRAIRTIGQLEFVDVLHDDHSLERRFITTGRAGIAGRVEVLSGVKAGERVILHAQQPDTAGKNGGTGNQDDPGEKR